MMGVLILIIGRQFNNTVVISYNFEMLEKGAPGDFEVKDGGGVPCIFTLVFNMPLYLARK